MKKTKSKKKEEFVVSGENLLKEIKKLIKEGNVRKVTIKNKQGDPIIVIPFTVGLVGALLAPPLAAVGAIAALVTECTLSVERR
jgi:hypothetical protein